MYCDGVTLLPHFESEINKYILQFSTFGAICSCYSKKNETLRGSIAIFIFLNKIVQSFETKETQNLIFYLEHAMFQHLRDILHVRPLLSFIDSEKD